LVTLFGPLHTTTALPAIPDLAAYTRPLLIGSKQGAAAPKRQTFGILSAACPLLTPPAALELAALRVLEAGGA